MYGYLPISYAAVNGHIDTIKLLIPCTNFTYQHPKYMTTIFTSIIPKASQEIVEYMFSFCTDINHVDWDGQTYLHQAVDRQQKYLVELLLQKGIDVNIQDRYGKLARDLTTNAEILQLLV